ncbi:MAG: 6-bladed beta-propeller [Prevotellaceae bacterium]|jgi:hypothetical protein|nr:6-bladed beta-propeller [Prevotellaceae bacterium]
MKYLIGVILCLTGLVACTSQDANIGFIRVKFSEASVPEFAVSKVTRLSSRDDALLGRFYRLKITSQYYVAGDRSKIIIYTKDGNIHAVINALGEGPHEVPDMSFFHADDSSIMVMNMWKSCMLEFDYDGHFLKTTELKVSYANFIRYKDGYLFDIQQRGTDAGNVLLLTDMNGEPVKDTIPVIGRGIAYGSDKFQVSKEDGALFLPSFSNTIYKIDEKNVSPFYSFDFGSHWANREECDKFVDNPSGDPFVLLKHLKRNDKICFLRFVDTPDWLVLNFEKQEKHYNWFYNKTIGKQHLVEYEENKANSLLDYYVIGSEGNEFVTLIPAVEYSQLSGLPKLTVSDEDNPVLVCYHLK